MKRTRKFNEGDLIKHVDASPETAQRIKRVTRCNYILEDENAVSFWGDDEYELIKEDKDVN